MNDSNRWLPRQGLWALVLLAGCASTPPPAPIEQRSVSRPPPAPTPPAAGLPAPAVAAPAAPPGGGAAASATGARPAAATTDPARPALPGAENAGKPGYYTVRPGDTLIRIGLESGQNWRDIARWNGIDNPNLIEVGQVLRVVAPPAVAVAQPVAPAGRAEPRPLDARPGPAAAGGPTAVAGAAPGGPGALGAPSAPGAAGAPAPGAAGAVVAPPAGLPAAASPAGSAASAIPAAGPRETDDEVAWAWPAGGTVLAGFDEARNKGIAIGGRAGDPVLAAADGRVVYAGSGLRGYGNLVIVKHNSTYLTAYAHNQALLVKEDQVVRRGQKIAEMGSSDAERVQLHFEIRRLGKPVEPVRLLPTR
ncbi:MAG: peptidoglycan DD-metalloendopeptidase family protein [Pseudomonadota bacterium]